jgi:diguanylate cyclase (GGDEF)-like protein
VLEVGESAEALGIARNEPVDLILGPPGRGPSGSEELLPALRESEATRDIPFLALLTDGAPESRREALEAGASDVLAPPFESSELEARVSVHLRVRRLDRARARAESQVDRLTRTDELTGLIHRRFLGFLLEREFARAVRNPDYGLGVLLVSAEVVDGPAHEGEGVVGELVFRHLAHRLQEIVRQEEIVARYDAETFAVVLTGVNRETTLRVAERVRTSAEAHDFGIETRPVHLTLSVGCAVFDRSLRSPEALLDSAEAALGEACRAAGGRIALAPLPG